MENKGITITYEDNIAIVCLANPKKANAIDESMWEQLQGAFVDLSDNLDVRAIILAAEGKHFCAGIDLEMLQNLFSPESTDGNLSRKVLKERIKKLQEAVTQIEICVKPVIGAIQGACIGAGLDIIAACDFRIATDSSHFSVKEAALGIVADLGSLQRLPPIVGEGIAREWALTCKKISSEEAYQKGLINSLYRDTETMLSEARRLALQIASHPTTSIQGTKRSLIDLRDNTIQGSLDFVANWNSENINPSEIKDRLGI